MLFNSLEFLLFLPAIFLLYWFVFQKDVKIQNILIVAASYLFYGWWDWRFLSLIIFSSLIDYTLGIQLGKTDNTGRRKALLWISMLVNLGFLGVFKYYNFFADSFADLLQGLGMNADFATLNILLPVGISFYTFQTMSYTIDVYRRKLEPTKDIFAFFAFVSFFPQLVAGPIERAKNLLPQFYAKRSFDETKAVDGMRQILWGFFKKVAIADTCAIYVNAIFADSAELSGGILLLGAVLFAFQIYGDFSGYSDIAIGTARLFGFNLMQNFAYPYFSRDIAEFWRRWHISLSSWFKDYLYIPLGGSRGGQWMQLRNVFAIFLVSGFWHGANWTFIVWGGLNALYFVPQMLLKTNRNNLGIVAQDNMLPSIKEVFQILLTFFLTCVAWVFFRAASVGEAFEYLVNMFTLNGDGFGTYMNALKLSGEKLTGLGGLIALLIVIEWIQRKKEHGLEHLKWAQPLRWIVYILLILIVLYHFGESGEFIYFQF